MIISELKPVLKGKNKGEPSLRHKCEVRCDQCEKEFKRRYGILLNSRKNFDNKDLCQSCSRRYRPRYSYFSEYNKNQKGKTLEERLGTEKAVLTKKKIKQAFTGEKNPNYGGKFSRFEKAIEYNTGKTYEEKFGKEKADEIKKKLSDKTKGENNPMYGKPSPQGSGNGWKGHYKGIYFRSMLELYYLVYLDENKIEFENGEMKKHSIPYEINGVKRNYFPDYFLVNTQEYIEIKPHRLVNSFQNSLKFDAAKKLLGKKFTILTEKNIKNIDIKVLWRLFQNKIIVFDKRYEEKFIQYYQCNNKGEI